jgi:Holliday junction DNA helicase RuvA
MIGYVNGIATIKSSDYIVVDVSGVGYKVYMTKTAIEKIELNTNVKVFTYMRVSQDDISLYGFLSNDELMMFQLLISVGGIGPKSATAILSNITPSTFALAVITDDVGKLKKLPGIGPKTAQRIILELKDKLKAVEDTNKEELEEMLLKSEDDGEKISEALSALQVLGYTRKEIEKAFEKFDKKDLSVEEIIKKGLLYLSK